jgi:hypothetical protein
MTQRWFVSHVAVGAVNKATEVADGRPAFTPTVQVTKSIGDQVESFPATGPQLKLLGPGDLQGFEPWVVAREEPPAGWASAGPDELACVEFSDAGLPWQYSRLDLDPDRPLPWIALLVLGEDEVVLTEHDPLPLVTVPGTALPDLADSWAWAHIEARMDDPAGGEAEIVADIRSGSRAMISRLICPRRLDPDRGWFACVVPTTNAGVAAGTGEDLHGDPFGAPWSPGQASPVKLPVYHSWTFRTGPAGSFEELARKVDPVQAGALPSFGSHEIDLRHPWPLKDLLPDAPTPLTTKLQGALRVPGTEVAEEAWSDEGSRQTFAGLLTERLDAPAQHFADVGAEVDRDEVAVAPPLYGSHFTGEQEVPAAEGWIRSLNLQVRHRVAAALGARYVQLEQEFLMARSWEQAGAIAEANRLLAVGELATEATERAQAKHVAGMEPTALTLMADPMRGAVEVEGTGTLAQVLEGSGLPDGAGSSAFRRLTRPGGGLDRRVARVPAAAAGEMPATESVLAEGLAAGRRILPESIAAVTAQQEEGGQPLGADPASLSLSRSLIGLIAGQRPLIEERNVEVSEQLNSMAGIVEGAMGDSMTAATVPPPATLRALRRAANGEELTELSIASVPVQTEVGAIAESVRAGIQPMVQQIDRLQAMVESPDVAARTEGDERPLRPIMSHPRFGMPIAAELLTRWPEWAVPGIADFPANSATLLETNSPFAEAVMVGLNQEFNRELLWREYPTDQRSTAFARFWPSDVSEPDVDEIARWKPEIALGAHDRTGGRDPLVLLVRAEVLQRFPGTTVHAARSVDGMLPPADGPGWLEPLFPLAIDEQTTLFAFELTAEQARAEKWLFVLREPQHGTRFGFDTGEPGALATWSDLTWSQVPVAAGFVVPRVLDGLPPTPSAPTEAEPAVWGRDAADVARIAFQRPFQLAVSAQEMLGG